MSLPSHGRGTGGQSGRRRSKLKLPPGVIPIVIVGVAIAAVWGGMKLIGPADAGAGQGEVASNSEDTPREVDPNPSTSGRGLLGGALEESGSRGAPSSRLGKPLPDAGGVSSGLNDLADAEDEAPISDPIAGEVDLPEIESTVASAGGLESSIPSTGTYSGSMVEGALDESSTLIASNQLVAARATLSETLGEPGLSASDQQRLRAALMDLNETIVFSPRILPGDTMVEEYRIASGDSLGKIARSRELGTHWKLIQRINGIARPERIRVGQRLKLVRGPFHAIVDKSDYRIDLFHGPPDEPERWLYITSRPVGLGLDDSTPVGRFIVREDSKLENPAWVNPRDPSDRYGRDDPDNPIGEFWVGLDGLGDDAVYVGYGLHGTVEPDSIGSQQSMGCVRMHDDDIALVYELLQEGASIVEIRP